MLVRSMATVVSLWGTHVCWLCDCDAIYTLMDYDGEIEIIRRIAQDLIAYQLNAVHRSAMMTADVGAGTPL